MIVLALLAAVSSGHFVDPNGLEACVVAKSAELAIQSQEPAETLVRVAFNRCDDKNAYEHRMFMGQSVISGIPGSEAWVQHQMDLRRVQTTDAAMDAIVSARAAKP